MRRIRATKELTMLDTLAAFFSSVPREIYVFLISILPIVELRGSIPVGAALGMPFYLNYPLSVVGNLLPIPFILMFIPRILDFMARFKIFRPTVEWLRKRALSKSAKVLGKDNAKVAPQTSEETKADAQANVERSETEATSSETSVIDEPISDGSNLTKSIEETLSPASNEEAAASDSKDAFPTKPAKMSKGVFLALMLFVAIPLPATGAWTGSLVAALFNLDKRQSMLAIVLGVLISGTIMSLASYGVLGFLSIFL